MSPENTATLSNAMAETGFENVKDVFDHFDEGGALPPALESYLKTMLPEYRDLYRVVANALENGYTIRDNQGVDWDIELQEPVKTLDAYHDATVAVWMQRLAVGYFIRIPALGVIGLETAQDGSVTGRFFKSLCNLNRKQKFYSPKAVYEDVRLTLNGMRTQDAANYGDISPCDVTDEDWELFVKAVGQSLRPVVKNVARCSAGVSLKRLGVVKRQSSNYTLFEPSQALIDLYLNYQALAPEELKV